MKTLTNTSLRQVKERMAEVNRIWNGDNPGKQEDRAHAADEILQKIKELEELLEEFDCI